MDDLEKNIRKLRQFDNLGESLNAIEKLIEEVVRFHETQAAAKKPQQTPEIANISV